MFSFVPKISSTKVAGEPPKRGKPSKAFTNITSIVRADRFFSLLADRKGNFWLANNGSGVYYYDGRSFQQFTTKQGLVSDHVLTSYEDKSGTIWFGANGGVSRYDGKSFQNFTTKEGLPSNEVNAILEDKQGNIWFGTRGDACLYDGKRFTVLTHMGQPFRNVRSIIEDKQGIIWLGGADGLWRFDGRSFAKLNQNFTNYIYQDKKGNIWTAWQSASNGRGILSRYDEQSLSEQEPTLTEVYSCPAVCWVIFQDVEGNVWFGAPDGLYRYDGNTITHF
jgi:ligand-binding sensor domain-containing protein